jgi:hypothetical protein
MQAVSIPFQSCVFGIPVSLAYVMAGLDSTLCISVVSQVY